MTYRLLDLYCCQGGASHGYALAGFEVVGVDIQPQPKYPYDFVHSDAIAYLLRMGHTFDAIHASPPCQLHSNAWRIRARDHPDLIEPTRAALKASGKPYVIENVVGAPLLEPVELCGAMFGLHTYRHRIFESNVELTVPAHPPHQQPTVKMGRALRDGEFYHAVGNFSNVPYIRRDLGAHWMTRDGLRESIPPAYAQYIGGQLLEHLWAQKNPGGHPPGSSVMPA